MRRIVGRATRPLRRRFRGPRVTVVVAASDQETRRIGPLLDSLRAQTHHNLDIVVAPWGRSEAVRAIAERHAGEDWRIRVMGDDAADATAALAGASLGPARYVIAPAAGDLLPRDALATLVGAAERSGSDAAVGRVAVPRQGYAVATTAYGVAHRTERLATTLAAAPEAVADLTPGARLYARRAWRPAGPLAGLAGTFDLLPDVTYLRAGRRDDVVFGARPHSLAVLEEWWAGEQQLLAALAESAQEASGWRRWALLDTHLQTFLDDAERATPEQWALLRRVIAELSAAPLPAAIGAEARVKLWLATEDRRDDLADLVLARTFEGADQPTRVVDGEVVAELPVPPDVPADLLTMSEAETPLRLEVRALTRTPSGRVTAEVVGWIDHLGLPSAPHLTLTPPVSIAQRHDPSANHGDRRPCHDVAHGAFTLSFDAPAGSTDRVGFQVVLTTQGVTRQGELVLDLGGPDRPLPANPGPLADDEAGPYHQRALQEAARRTSEPIEPHLFYLQSYGGHHATDSQRALHVELRRRFPHLRLVWGVAGPDVPLPEGAEAVVIGSRAWHRTMATAHYLCVNADPDRWFVRREGQLLLQTFHGYPSKAMGRMMWRAKGYGDRRIAWETDRARETWSLILTPTEEMAAHYREQYAYDGPILSVGYPRDDALVAPDASATRTRVRTGLGIAPEQRAVLYAPTWRDDLATDWRSAEAALHLDVAAAARDLGPGYVLMLRGHRFHRLPQVSARGARIIDVTDHPEVNDLILAADAAVVDYSSIRFDLAFAEVPQVFLVPDLESYGSSKRGFLYPFVETAPGPLVATTAEVVEQLRDLDGATGLRSRTAADVAAFNDRFHPHRDDRAAARVVDELAGRWNLAPR